MNQEQFISTIAIIVVAAMTVVWLLRRAKFRRARNWPTANGQTESTSVILKSGGGQPGAAAYFAEVKYSYTVQGHTYYGGLRRRFILRGRADRWIAGYANNNSLIVRYNPNTAADSVLIESDRVS